MRKSTGMVEKALEACLRVCMENPSRPCQLCYTHGVSGRDESLHQRTEGADAVPHGTRRVFPECRARGPCESILGRSCSFLQLTSLAHSPPQARCGGPIDEVYVTGDHESHTSACLANAAARQKAVAPETGTSLAQVCPLLPPPWTASIASVLRVESNPTVVVTVDNIKIRSTAYQMPMN